MVDAFLSLLMELNKVPADHMGQWQKQGQSYSFWTVDDDRLVAALHPGDIYLLEARTKNEDGGILTTAIIDTLTSPDQTLFSGECSRNGQEQQIPGLVARFEADQAGSILSNPTHAWQSTPAGFTPVSTEGVICVNSYLDPHAEHEAHAGHDSHDDHGTHAGHGPHDDHGTHAGHESHSEPNSKVFHHGHDHSSH